MGNAEAVPTFGWPTWMNHAHREQHSHVVEIINPGNAAASPADIDKHVLHGRPGEFVMEASFHGKPPDWWITCDVDLVRRRIDARRARADVGGHIVRGTPKSHQSRTVPIPRTSPTNLII